MTFLSAAVALMLRRRWVRVCRGVSAAAIMSMTMTRARRWRSRWGRRSGDDRRWCRTRARRTRSVGRQVEIGSTTSSSEKLRQDGTIRGRKSHSLRAIGRQARDRRRCTSYPSLRSCNSGQSRQIRTRRYGRYFDFFFTCCCSCSVRNCRCRSFLYWATLPTRATSLSLVWCLMRRRGLLFSFGRHWLRVFFGNIGRARFACRVRSTFFFFCID